jgi:hypothetical protein
MSDAPVDPFSLSPEQAGAKLAELTATYRGAPSEHPQSKLNRLYADPEKRGKIEAGDGATRREFDALAQAAANADPVEAALAGQLPDVPSSELRQKSELASFLRTLGLRDEVVREAIDTDSTVNRETHDAAKDWKARNLSDETFVKAYLNGSVEHVKQVTLCNIILMQPIAEKAK